MLKYVLPSSFCPRWLWLFELAVRKGVNFPGRAMCIVLMKLHLSNRANTCSMVVCESFPLVCLISALVVRIVEHGRARLCKHRYIAFDFSCVCG